MNRAELISEIAELTGQPKTEVGMALTGILTGRNPRTLAPLRIPSSRVPAFRAGQELKDVVDGRSRLKSYQAPGTKSSTKKTASKASKAKKR